MTGSLLRGNILYSRWCSDDHDSQHKCNRKYGTNIHTLQYQSTNISWVNLPIVYQAIFEQSLHYKGCVFVSDRRQSSVQRKADYYRVI